MTDRWLTVEEISQTLVIHRETVRRWVRSGELRSLRLGRRGGYRVKQSDLDSFLERFVWTADQSEMHTS